jgi:uncharacterized lipoprotein YajG
VLKLLTVLVATYILVGCATPASHQAMTIGTTDVTVQASEKLKGQVFVRSVTGGKDTNPLWTSQVDSQSFKMALEQSLAALGYKSDSAAAKYKIDANLQDLNQPGFGLTFNVQSTVAYTVATDAGTNNVPITATGTATPSEAFVAIERLKIANERSIKENIKAFVTRLTNQFGN